MYLDIEALMYPSNILWLMLTGEGKWYEYKYNWLPHMEQMLDEI